MRNEIEKRKIMSVDTCRLMMSQLASYSPFIRMTKKQTKLMKMQQRMSRRIEIHQLAIT